MEWSATARTIGLPQDEFDRIKHLPLRLDGEAAVIGDYRVPLHDSINCGDLGTVPVALLARAALRFHRLTRLGRTPQIAALLFDAVGDPRFLGHYFPLARTMCTEERKDFFTIAGKIAAHPHLDIRLIDEGRLDRTPELARSARWIIAGCLAEVLWRRRDILTHILKRRRHIRLYTSEIAFAESSGLSSGHYHAGRHSIDVTLTDLYTGFYSQVPGVAPFLRGLGAMMDDCDARHGRMGAANGMLPGLGRHDGLLTMPQARELFLAGKRLERERYERYRAGYVRPGTPMPFGDPSLFCDDRVFIAGYFELFFRAPHALAIRNPQLFEAFTILLGQDPRTFWVRDCTFYLDQNEALYSSRPRLLPAGIHVQSDWWPF